MVHDSTRLTETERERLGAGIGLDEDFDLVIDETGGIKTVFGMNELTKDAAYFIEYHVSDLIGSHLTQNTLERIRIEVEDVLDTFDRIDAVDNVEVEEAEDPNLDVRVRASVTVSNSQQDLIFPL